MGARNYKIVVIGDPAVGKTSLVRRYVDDKFSEDYLRTLGFEISVKTIQINGNPIVLSIWDVGGDLGAMQRAYIKGSRGIFVVFDLSRRPTYDSVRTWIQLARESENEVPVILVGNKNDLRVECAQEREIRTLCEDLKISAYYRVSAKTGVYVAEMFQFLAESVMDAQASVNLM